ncbi:MAG: hypothetical protein KAI15_02135, partial [Gammaproteobacteria bacterium]|nr:hypothetical protein [Gammaproteobacteria bacterium]
LRNNSIKYDLSVAVVEGGATRGQENYNIGGYAIPIRCRGSLDDLASACKPDYGKLLGVAVQKGALDKLGESIGIDLSGQKKSTTETTTKTTQPPATDTTQQPKSEPKSEPKSVEEAILESVLDSLPF